MKNILQVPYYDKIQNAESKLDHVTASVKAHEYLESDQPTRGHISMNGFNDKGPYIYVVLPNLKD